VPRYPDIEPYDSGLLDTGDGNLVYRETCGNRDGVPALVTAEAHAAADRLYDQITNPR
jgi:hypothetical protein